MALTDLIAALEAEVAEKANAELEAGRREAGRITLESRQSIERRRTEVLSARESALRRELGPDAIIVETKRVSGRALGLLGGTFVEVTAAAGEADPGPRKRMRTSTTTPTPATTTMTTSPLLARQRATRNREPGPQRNVRSSIAEEPSAALAAASGVRPHAALRRRLLPPWGP